MKYFDTIDDILFHIILIIILFYSITLSCQINSVIKILDNNTLSEKVIEKNNNYICTITAYTPSKDETNNNPQLTATMEKPISGGTCAVSRDLMHWLGGRIYIEGIGVRRVNDLMNKRFKKRVDLCVPTKTYAKDFGIKKHITVVFLGR